MSDLRVGIIGCGHAARVHVARLCALPDVQIVGVADPDEPSARDLTAIVSAGGKDSEIRSFGDHVALLKHTTPDAIAVFTPHLFHYRPVIDALQAGCHVFVEKPLSTNVQEAVDIVNVARARGRLVGVGHQFRLLPSLVEARNRLNQNAIGALKMVTATLAQPWLADHQGAEHDWRFDPRVSGGGVLADAGDHLIDALLWSVHQVAVEASAFQKKIESGIDVVTAASIRLADGTPVALGLCGDSPGSLFELTYFGEKGRIRVTEDRLIQETLGGSAEVVPLVAPIESIDGNFASAIRQGTPLCCPADQALDTVRLLEAIGRSAAIGQTVRLG